MIWLICVTIALVAFTVAIARLIDTRFPHIDDVLRELGDGHECPFDHSWCQGPRGHPVCIGCE